MANTRGKIILAHISILFARDLNFCDSQKDGLNERFLIDLRLLKLELAIEFSIQSCRLRLLTSMSNPLLISKWFVVILVGGFSFWLFWQVVCKQIERFCKCKTQSQHSQNCCYVLKVRKFHKKILVSSILPKEPETISHSKKWLNQKTFVVLIRSYLTK